MIVSRHVISTACRCHGCDKISKFVKGGEKEMKAFVTSKGWEERMDLRYGKNASRRRGMGWVMNFYCPKCVKKGVTAAAVAEQAKVAGKSAGEGAEHVTVGKSKTRKVPHAK